MWTGITGTGGILVTVKKIVWIIAGKNGMFLRATHFAVHFGKILSELSLLSIFVGVKS